MNLKNWLFLVLGILISVLSFSLLLITVIGIINGTLIVPVYCALIAGAGLLLGGWLLLSIFI